VSRVRVLRLIARMNVGGPAQQIVGLQRGLDRDRFESRLVTGTVGSGEEDHLHLRAPELEVLRLPELGRSIRAVGDIRALSACVRELRRFQPHILHTHTAKAGVLGRIAARLADVPLTVHTYHGHLLHGYFPAPVTAAIRSVERSLAPRTDWLLAVGERVRDDLLDAGIGSPAQYRVVPPGVAVSEAPPRDEARRDLRLSDDGSVVSYVARLTQIKRPLRFIELVRAVAPWCPDAQFLVAGEGPLLPTMREAARGLPVRFLGWRSDVERVYAASDVTVLTSDNEGMPVSLIEAGLCGRAAIATDVGSVREVVQDGVTGRVLPVTDSEGMSRALRDLLGDRTLLSEMGDRARERCRARFAMERLVGDTEELYEQLVDTML
jgi:glycosyltransferase involved in cell wall biosynthesis